MTTLITAADTFGLTGLASWFKKINAKLQHQARVRQTIKDLSRLSDHDLNDIGIGRGDIYNIAHGDPTLKRSDAEANINLKGWV